MEWVLSTGTAARLCLVLQRGPCRGTWHSRCHPSVPGTANSIPSIRPSVPVCVPIPSMLWAGAACCMGSTVTCAARLLPAGDPPLLVSLVSPASPR